MSARTDYAKTRQRGASRDSAWEFSDEDYERAMDEMDRLRAVVFNAGHIIEESGQIEGDHHKAWVLDQVMRVLLGDSYPQWRHCMEYDPEGNHYSYDEGIAP